MALASKAGSHSSCCIAALRVRRSRSVNCAVVMVRLPIGTSRNCHARPTSTNGRIHAARGGEISRAGADFSRSWPSARSRLPQIARVGSGTRFAPTLGKAGSDAGRRRSYANQEGAGEGIDAEPVRPVAADDLGAGLHVRGSLDAALAGTGARPPGDVDAESGRV